MAIGPFSMNEYVLCYRPNDLQLFNQSHACWLSVPSVASALGHSAAGARPTHYGSPPPKSSQPAVCPTSTLPKFLPTLI